MQNATIIIQITAHSNVMHTNNMYGACCLAIFVHNAHENTSRKLSVNSNGYLKVLILLGQGILKLRQKNDMIEPEEGNFAPIFEDMECLTEEKVDCNKVNYIATGGNDGVTELILKELF